MRAATTAPVGDLAIAYRDIGPSWTTVGRQRLPDPTRKIWLPGKELLADRIAYAQQQGLQHVIFWELWHDLPPSECQFAAADRVRNAGGARRAISTPTAKRTGPTSALDQHFGAESSVTGSMGDANNDNRVDGTDFLLWQRHVNAQAGASHAVPEPPALPLILIFALVLVPRRCRDLRLHV